MNVKMWIEALRIIPQVSKEEWLKLDIISKWLISVRGAVLVMTFISATIAGLFAQLNNSFSWGPFLLLTIGLIMAHATNNLINDLTDYKKGVDKDNYYRSQYGPQPLEHGLLTIGQIYRYITVTGVIALIAGIIFYMELGAPVIYLILAGSFFVLFYTFPLKYIGLGELAVLLVWGPLMIGGGYFVITTNWSWNVVIASLPYAISVTTVLFGKHIDKFDADRAKRIHTLPVIIGEEAARFSVITMMIMQYLIVIYLVVIQFISPILLIILLAVPKLIVTLKIFSNPKPTVKPKDYPDDSWPIWFVGYAFLHNRRWGSLFMLGLIIEVIFKTLS